MRIDEMERLFNDRIDMHDRELKAFGKADQIVPEFVRFYAASYRNEVGRIFKIMVPDEGSAYEINADRLKLIAWQHNEHAWNRMRSALHSGFGSAQGETRAMADAWAHQEIAANFWAMSEGRWLPDMGGRIPNR
jgi:hypothetical protein